MRKIIAFTGTKGSGKDTAAAILCKHYKDARQIAFADPIKKFIMKLFDLPTTMDYDVFKRSTINYNFIRVTSGRHVVREIGMLMRNYDVDQFTRYVAGEFAKYPQATFAVTDLRFDNELIMLKEQGAVVVEIANPNVPRGTDNHVTELGFASEFVDHVIYNDSTVEVFEQRLIELYKQIL
jgi:hypothetical protein